MSVWDFFSRLFDIRPFLLFLHTIWWYLWKRPGVVPHRRRSTEPSPLAQPAMPPAKAQLKLAVLWTDTDAKTLKIIRGADNNLTLFYCNFTLWKFITNEPLKMWIFQHLTTLKRGYAIGSESTKLTVRFDQFINELSEFKYLLNRFMFILWFRLDKS